MALLSFIAPLIVGLIVHTILSAKYRDVEKVDKGFVLNYHRLTYRRKLIRSLWGIPFVFLIYLAIYWIGYLSSDEYRNIGIIFLLIVVADIAYHYRKWKKNGDTKA
ncbi:hypothetical protein KO561_14590 [Radiobacillus kanasensis]|uniref:hypothetical protein n=1 Tax=Radiobacillus kanasensis TaxID=2844358 RepID=UPI001E5BEC25|nr:hypothetical protein [Radiobacillus kanasensis]UFT98416.1 hypothetical protein KO561_14590 [Radiobacillus kanasensis]